MNANKQISMIEQTKFSPIDLKSPSNHIRKDEYIDAMVEDLCEWLNFLYRLDDENKLISSNFFTQLEDGIILNKHAIVVQYLAENYLKSRNNSSRDLPLKIGNKIIKVPLSPPKFVTVDFSKKSHIFQKRDNVSNFIQWCRNFNIPPSLTFETEDLIMLKNQRNVVVCLLEVARIGRLFGMEVPDIIQLEEEIDNEMQRQINEEIIVDNQQIDKSIDENPQIDKPIDENPQIDKPIDENGNDIPELNFDFSNVTMRKKTTFSRSKNNENDNEESKMDIFNHNEIDTNDYHDNLSISLESGNFISTESNYLQDLQLKHLSTVNKIDSSDTESMNSCGVPYTIPKYKTSRPVGRVKIYDCFERNNLAKEKKYREKCDMRSLDERVREILSECQCSETFPMKRISEGKYQWGDKKTHIFVRILRNHVMVRVGGGWDTLNEFLRKHDHCRKERIDLLKPMCATYRRLKPSTTCPNDLKNMNQNGNQDYQNQFHSETSSTILFPPKSTRHYSMMINNEKAVDTENCSQKSNQRPISLTYSQTTNDFNHKSVTPEVEQCVQREFENKENSSIVDNNEKSELLRKSYRNSVISSDKLECRESDSKNIKKIQSNQKYLSRIPVLKKR